MDLLLNTVKRVFPTASVEQKDEFVVIDGFLYIAPVKLTIQAISGPIEADGFQLTLGTDEGDVCELEENQSMGLVIVAAAKYYGGWMASRVLEQIGNEQLAEELKT